MDSVSCNEAKASSLWQESSKTESGLNSALTIDVIGRVITGPVCKLPVMAARLCLYFPMPGVSKVVSPALLVETVADAADLLDHGERRRDFSAALSFGVGPGAVRRAPVRIAAKRCGCRRGCWELRGGGERFDT